MASVLIKPELVFRERGLTHRLVNVDGEIIGIDLVRFDDGLWAPRFRLPGGPKWDSSHAARFPTEAAAFAAAVDALVESA